MSNIVIGIRTFKDVDQLEKLVIHLATEYDLGNPCEDFEGNDVSDTDYDDLYRELKKLNPKSSAFEGTTPSIVTPTGGTVKHDPPMTSIAKADGSNKQKIYDQWKADCAKGLHTTVEKVKFAQSYKRDGVAVRVNYVKGKLVSAGLRPRGGIDGTDVTAHMKYVEGVPQTLKIPLTLSLNGELECLKKTFKKINEDRDEAGEDAYKNPRNYTAGCMGRDDVEEIKDAGISVVFYSITGFDDWHKHYKTEIERAKWANQTLGLGSFIRFMSHNEADLQKMEDAAKDLPYEVDGIVVKVNDLECQEQLGHHGDNLIKEPRGSIAWKFIEKTAIAEVREIQWNASRTGRVVPKVIFKAPVNLADTDVTQATANNVGWAKAANLGVDAKIEVKKAGKIIPNVVRVVQPGQKCDPPKNCPACASELKTLIGKSGCQDLMCLNKECGAKHINHWVFYLQVLGTKGLGKSGIEKILASGKAKTIADLYALDLDDWVAAGFSERQALLAMATVHMVKPVKDDKKLAALIGIARGDKKKVKAWQFFKALGIPGAGESTGKALIQTFRTFEKIRQATLEELLAVDGVGDITANAIYHGLKERNSLIQKLLDHVDLELPKSGKLSGAIFVLTGSFDLGKAHWKSQIENLGGTVSESVSADSYLVMQHGKTDGSPSGKELAAAKKGRKNHLGPRFGEDVVMSGMAMKVSELIEALRQYPQDAKVQVFAEREGSLIPSMVMGDNDNPHNCILVTIQAKESD